MAGTGLNLELDKGEANRLFELADYKGALQIYRHVLESGASGELAGQVCCNMAECYLRLGDFERAQGSAEDALGHVSQGSVHEKACYRKARAIEGLGVPQLALQAFHKMLEMYPENSAAKLCIKRLEGRRNDTSVHEAYQKMFKAEI